MTLTNLFTGKVFNVYRIGNTENKPLVVLPGVVVESPQENNIPVAVAFGEVEEEDDEHQANVFVVNRGPSLLRQDSFLSTSTFKSHVPGKTRH